jgi:hypothetical protein
MTKETPDIKKVIEYVLPEKRRKRGLDLLILFSVLPHSPSATSTSRSSSSLLHILHSPRLPRELVRHEQPPRVFVAFPDALSPACVFQNRPAAPACISRSLLE